METVDEEFIGAALDFMERKTKEGNPWFCYFNPTRMHVFTHLKPSSEGKTGLGLYPDGMVALDGYVGQRHCHINRFYCLLLASEHEAD